MPRSPATYGDGGLALDDRPGLWSKGAPGSSGALREALRRAELFLWSSSAPPQRRRRTWCDALGWLLRTHPSSTPEMTRSAELDLQTVQPRRDSRPYSFDDGSNRFYSCGAIGELVTRKEKLALAPVESRSIKTRTCAQAESAVPEKLADDTKDKLRIARGSSEPDDDDIGAFEALLNVLHVGNTIRGHVRLVSYLAVRAGEIALKRNVVFAY